jgi:hypothetical protein
MKEVKEDIEIVDLNETTEKIEISDNSTLDDDYEIIPHDIDFSQKSPKQKVIHFLKQDESNYDTEHALVLVQSQNFKEGIYKIKKRNIVDV